MNRIKLVLAVLLLALSLVACESEPCKPGKVSGCCTAGWSGDYCCKLDSGWKCW